MTEILTEEEIKTLLTAISSGEMPDEPARTSGKRVKIVDFKRPDKFSTEQFRKIHIIHEQFSRLAAGDLSAELRALVSIHVVSVDQLTFEEFTRSIPNPSALCVFEMEPGGRPGVFEIDPSISFAIIDRLFGGKGEYININREFTDLELTVMKSHVTRILGNLREAWKGILDFRPRLTRISANPQFLQVAEQNDFILLISMETRIGDVEGMINLCIPYEAVESVLPALSGQNQDPINSRDADSISMFTLNNMNRLYAVEMYQKFSPGNLWLTHGLKKGDALSPDLDAPGRVQFSARENTNV